MAVVPLQHPQLKTVCFLEVVEQATFMSSLACDLVHLLNRALNFLFHLINAYLCLSGFKLSFFFFLALTSTSGMNKQKNCTLI